MKHFILISFVLGFALLACGQQSAIDGSKLPAEWTAFTHDEFSVNLPATWEEVTSDDEQVIYSVSNGSASLWIKSWPLIPRLVAQGVREWVDEDGKASLLSESGNARESVLEMAIRENLNELRLSSLLIYCEAKTYEVTGVALAKQFDQYTDIFKQVQESAVCTTTESYPKLDSGALGMIIIPPAMGNESFSPTAYQESLALARKSGVQVSHYYFHWGDIEIAPEVYDWTIPDYIVEANALEELQISIVVSIIHTTVRGRIPEDLIGLSFDDPVFVRRLSNFLSSFAARYSGQLDYLSIGNEVNNYFVNRREEIPAYASAFEQTRAAIQAVNPDLPVGVIFAYHDAETLDTSDVIRQLNLGDFIGYTMYLYNQGFHFRRDPAEIGEYLDRMVELADGVPIIITETGWSTATELDGSEEGQAEYVRELLNALADRRQQFQFVSWFAMHDPQPESCKRDVFTFFEPGTEPGPEFMSAFETFICYFGLRKSDGTPKLAWDVWVNEVQDYHE